MSTAPTPDTLLQRSGATEQDWLMFDAALAAASNGIVISDARRPDMPIQYVNDGFVRMTGYSPEEVIGRNCRFLQGPEPDPAVRAEFKHATSTHTERTVLVRNYRRDGTAFWNEVKLSPVRQGGVVTHYVGIQSDVTDRVEAEERARFLADRDPLTGLANRRLLQERLASACRQARVEGTEAGLLYLDVDEFKQVNDSRGHGTGDELLRQLSARLEEVVRPADLLARLGGDEFAIVLGPVPDAAAVSAEVADRVLAALRQPMLVQGEAVDVRVSIGTSTFPGDGESAAALLQQADVAMYAAKRSGGAAVSHFRRTDTEVLVRPLAPEPLLVVPTGAERELTAILEAQAIVSVYQPIVDLRTHAVRGFEALARGPEGSSLVRPDLLFATAAATGRTAELEWACRTAALSGALDGGLDPSATLFVNLEPTALALREPRALRALMAEAVRSRNVVLELTERALTDRPSDVLNAVPRYRSMGFAIALDDVGADPRSLALMPFLKPEVIKLDLRLVQDRPTPALASIVHAVNAEAERSGALVLAEGIETAEQEQTALALGASAGQGWHYGRPAAPGTHEALPAGGPWRIATNAAHPTEDRTPYEVVTDHVAPRVGTKRLLYSISKQLEAQVITSSDATVLLATFQEARHFTPKTQARYRRFGQSAAFVGALGVNMDPEPVPGVRGASLDAAEPLRGEWDVIVVDPHFAAAFVATDLGDVDRPDWERRFAFCLTYDRGLAVEAARSLMRRVTPRAG